MKTRVLDSWAILEWISGRQPGTDIVRKLFSEAEEGRSRLLLSASNAGEVTPFSESSTARRSLSPGASLPGLFR